MMRKMNQRKGRMTKRWRKPLSRNRSQNRRPKRTRNHQRSFLLQRTDDGEANGAS